MAPLFAFTVLPATLAHAFTPLGPELSAAALLLFCTLAVLDALGVLRRLRGVSVSFPERLNLTRNREGTLEFRVAAAGVRPLRLLAGVELPRGVAGPQQNATVRVSVDGETGVACRLIGTERGVHLIERCHLRFPSPLQLWYGQAAFPAGTNVHVYPSLQLERKKLAALFLRSGDAQLRPHRQMGRGREFEKLRSYLPGDSLGDIHWKATAKRGHPVTKEFRIERTQEVYCIVDSSRLSARAPGEGEGQDRDPLLERFLTAGLLLASVARGQGDLFGVMAFSDRPHAFIRARSGAAHFGACREALSGVHASPVTPNFEEAAAFLMARLRRRALLMFLTSLDEPVLAEGFTRAIRVLGRRHLVVVNAVCPATAHPMFSGQGAESAEDVYDRLGGHLAWNGLRQAQENLRRLGVELSLADRERFSATLVTGYLTIKRRQLL